MKMLVIGFAIGFFAMVLYGERRQISESCHHYVALEALPPNTFTLVGKEKDFLHLDHLGIFGTRRSDQYIMIGTPLVMFPNDVIKPSFPLILVQEKNAFARMASHKEVNDLIDFAVAERKCRLDLAFEKIWLNHGLGPVLEDMIRNRENNCAPLFE